MPPLYSVEARLTEEEIEVLDQACEVIGSCDADSHARFLRTCLHYGLLSLREAGLLQFPDGTTPEFVRLYDEAAAYLAEGGATSTEPASGGIDHAD